MPNYANSSLASFCFGGFLAFLFILFSFFPFYFIYFLNGLWVFWGHIEAQSIWLGKGNELAQV
jgi:hypothetical protein